MKEMIPNTFDIKIHGRVMKCAHISGCENKGPTCRASRVRRFFRSTCPSSFDRHPFLRGCVVACDRAVRCACVWSNMRARVHGGVCARMHSTLDERKRKHQTLFSGIE